MSQMQIHKGIAYEGAPKVIMARIVGAAATNITQATVNAISYIADQYDSEPEQTDNDWEADDEGYNFKMTLPPATFPLGNKWVRVSVWIDPTSGDDFPGFIGIFEVIATTKD
jgi:hypothetical protein